MQTIYPFLWFVTEAEDAANYYVSIFPNSKIVDVMRWGKNMPQPEGTVLTITIDLNGTKFTFLNGNADSKFTQATSFMVPCDTQEEIDAVYDKLLVGGSELACGWLTDKFGVTWQVAPIALMHMISSKDPAKSQRAMQAMMQMKKLDLPTLQKAFEGN